MAKNNFIIDLDDAQQYYSEFQTIAIILHKTGVLYTVQADGVGCGHPHSEGFIIFLGNFAQDFNDCSYGCYSMKYPDNTELRQNLAKDFDKYCEKYFAAYPKLKYTIKFDYERINELMEGWTPVIINGLFDDWNKTYFDNCKAIIHTGNCD